MYVDTVVASGQVAKVHDYTVAHFGANDWSQDPQPFKLRLAVRKSVVGILDVPGFGPAPMESPGIRKFCSVHQFESAWSVVPLHLFRGDVILARVALGELRALRKSGCSAGQEKGAKQGSDKPFAVRHHRRIPLSTIDAYQAIKKSAPWEMRPYGEWQRLDCRRNYSKLRRISFGPRAVPSRRERPACRASCSAGSAAWAA